MNKLENKTPRKSEKYFQNITETFSDIFIITDQVGHIKYCSRSVERYTGYKPEEIIGRSALSFVHPDDVHHTADDYDKIRLKDKKALLPDTLRIIHKNGSIIYLDGLEANLLENQDVAGLVITARDSTERKQTEEKLLQSEAFWKASKTAITKSIWRAALLS